MPRNHPRIVQTSMFLVQGWRANVDIQYILYDDILAKTTASDISQVSDYIISYICKGTETSVQEKHKLKDLVMNSEECTGDVNDVKRLSRKIMNESTKNRIISKQESMCHVGRLPLFLCSENIENVSLSGYRRIGTDSQAQTTFITTYANRLECYNMSLDQYFDYKKNKQSRYSKQNIIPNYVGGKIECLYPLMGSQARSFLMVYTPWSRRFPHEGKPNDVLVKLFEEFLRSQQCPPSLKYAYLKARDTYLYDLKQPVNICQPLSTNLNEAMQIDDQAHDIAALTALLPCNFDHSEFSLQHRYNFGEDHDWTAQTYQVIFSTKMLWLRFSFCFILIYFLSHRCIQKKNLVDGYVIQFSEKSNQLQGKFKKHMFLGH